MHSAAEVSRFFDEELAKLLAEPAAQDPAEAQKFKDARAQSEAMIVHGYHDPI